MARWGSEESKRKLRGHRQENTHLRAGPVCSHGRHSTGNRGRDLVLEQSQRVWSSRSMAEGITEGISLC